MVGDHEFDEDRLRQFVYQARVSVISVDYRLAPEHPFPTGLNDSYAALKWVKILLSHSIWLRTHLFCELPAGRNS